MKRAGTILFLSVYLSAYTVVGQVFLLPTLFHHYLEHTALEDITFLRFIAEHYADDIQHPDDEHHDHDNLPFKAKGVFQTSVVSAVIPNQLILIQYSLVEGLQFNLASYSPFHSTSSLSSIWHPPCRS